MAIWSIRTFFESIPSRLGAAHGRNESLTLLHFDVERLADVNLRCGREAGDRLLAEIEVCVARACRPAETWVRFSGDEWLLLLLGTSDAQAVARAREVLEQVASLAPPTPARTASCRARVRVLPAPDALWAALAETAHWTEVHRATASTPPASLVDPTAQVA